MSYDGESIVYDASGNPTTYRGATLGFEAGRRLKSYKKAGDANAYEFTFDCRGVRKSKKTKDADGHDKTWSFYYDEDGKLWGETKSEKVLQGNFGIQLWTDKITRIGFFHLNSGLAGFTLSRQTGIADAVKADYIYRKNALGDIDGIFDTDMNLIGEYVYDAWGNCTIEATGADNIEIMETNPFRYRGYYWDKELKFTFRYFPWWVLVFAVYPLFHRWRKRIAVNRLRHNEARNCGFINELPIVSITCGSMGKRKTTMITDMTLSQEVMFRQKALAIIQNTDLKFPCFPWLMFEKELRSCMEHGTVYNLATTKEWVKLKRQRFLKHRNPDLQLYGYDYKRYGAIYDDALKISSLFDAMETYAQAYFIYVIECSLIVANYSVRTDNKLIDGGNFPVWATDFFSEIRRKSRHSHVLDFDVLRLGKKVLENNPNAGSFEFGVVAITEIGKERGNNLELKEVKKGGDETNQKNDLFNSWLKMCRHSATVDNYPFIKVFTDEQRPESWGADARDLCEIIQIASSGDMKLALPFYTVEDMVSEWAFNRFIRLYYDFRFRRGDNTLLVYLLKGVTAWLWKRNARIYNRYGYSILKIEKERGTMDGKPEKKKYYLANGKIYANRFSTDCFSDYFNDTAKKSKVGLRDYIEYATEKASVEELKMQNSYFINGLYKDADGSA